jgi:hypothetical protein
MIPKRISANLLRKVSQYFLAFLCAVSLVPGDAIQACQSQQATPPAEEEQAPKIPPDQLDSLVAPVALYPDPMLAQVLAASTYPLEIIQLQQWLEKNKNLKDKALVDAVEKQPWDASVQGLAALPDVVKRLANDIQWTTDLGNAFLAQQSDVMEAVQRMRKKAEGNGNLKSNEQQKVETKVVESKQVIVIEQAKPEVIYVPSYNPTVVYGAPVYPYPPVAYPPPGYYAAGVAISFGVGLAMGAAWGGGWGYNCGWGGGGNNNITINNNNNFNRNSNINGGNRNTSVGGGNRVSNQPARGGGNGGNWSHNPQHRGGTPYGNKATAQKYGGSARGDSMSNRQSNARQNQAQAGNRGQSGSGSARPSQGGDRGGQPGAANRASSSGARDSSANRGSGGSSGGGDRIGNQRVSSSSGGSKGGGALGGASGQSGGAARASSQRGSSSAGRSSGRSGGGGRRR